MCKRCIIGAGLLVLAAGCVAVLVGWLVREADYAERHLYDPLTYR